MHCFRWKSRPSQSPSCCELRRRRKTATTVCPVRHYHCHWFKPLVIHTYNPTILVENCYQYLICFLVVSSESVDEMNSSKSSSSARKSRLFDVDFFTVMGAAIIIYFSTKFDPDLSLRATDLYGASRSQASCNYRAWIAEWRQNIFISKTIPSYDANDVTQYPIFFHSGNIFNHMTAHWPITMDTIL